MLYPTSKWERWHGVLDGAMLNIPIQADYQQMPIYYNQEDHHYYTRYIPIVPATEVLGIRLVKDIKIQLDYAAIEGNFTRANLLGIVYRKCAGQPMQGADLDHKFIKNSYDDMKNILGQVILSPDIPQTLFIKGPIELGSGDQILFWYQNIVPLNLVQQENFSAVVSGSVEFDICYAK